MEVATGKSILNGIAIGRLCVYRAPSCRVSGAPCADPARELERLETARQAAMAQQRALYEKARTEADDGIAEVFNIHAMMLDDPEFLGSIRAHITGERHTAEYAVKAAGDAQAQVFAALDDPDWQARGADVRDITQGLLDALQGAETFCPPGTGPFLLAAQDLTPSETVRLDRARLLGFVTREGSLNSHTAILARSMGVPALVQCAALSDAWDGRPAVLDGYSGRLYLDPEPALLDALTARRDADLRQTALLRELAGKPSVTRDGTAVEILANIGGPADLDAVRRSDADGVGLFRSEFLYLHADHAPTEAEQFAAYRQVLAALAPKRVVIRTCDLGADKTVPYLDLGQEANPALGCRAIRLCLSDPAFFKTQLRALLRASAYGDLGILFPMLTGVGELRQCRALAAQCRAELAQEGVPMGAPQFGAMIETPAAVLCADELAQACDFFSLGTNDLLQYTCALDRQNARLEPFLDPHHPALLREIGMTVEAGHRHGCHVAICGELGADLTLTETFLRMGVDALSVNPVSVLPLRAAVRALDLSRPKPEPQPKTQP
jgi:phosphotransferase system enzyme I (PtsI)